MKTFQRIALQSGFMISVEDTKVIELPLQKIITPCQQHYPDCMTDDDATTIQCFSSDFQTLLKVEL